MSERLGRVNLLIVGVLTLSEGRHQALLKRFGYPVEAMSETTFYFSVAVTALFDLARQRGKTTLSAMKKTEMQHAA